jgi:exonuclease-1
MGIQGLLKGVQPFASKKSSIRDFQNQSLAVDASSWLHKSVYSISAKYVESIEKSRTVIDPACVRVSANYMQKRCQELLTNASIRTIYLVLDGKRCPLKAQTNDNREARRNKNLTEARRFRKQGRQDKAEEKYKHCIKIHNEFAYAVAAAVTKHFASGPNSGKRVQCIYSPHEADAQLVKLCVDGIADAIITEDSDVLVYSASCGVPMPIIYKLDRHRGDCDVVSMEWLLSATKESEDRKAAAATAKKSGGALEAILMTLVDREVKRPGLGVRLFVQACVLAGSDYSPNILNGIGLVTAFKLVRDNAHRPCDERFRRVLSSLSKKNKGTEDMEAYEEVLAQSEAVFYLHPVLDCKTKKVKTLTSPRFAADEDHPIGYVPLLERFDAGGLAFLGNVDIAGTEALDLPVSPMTQATMFSVKEVIVKEKKRKRDTVPEKAARKRGETDDDNGANEAQRLVQSVKNPYNKSSQRKLFGDVTNTATQESSRSNFLGKFAHGTTKSKPQNDSGYSTYVDKRTDLRFTKRQFGKNGRPVPNPNLRKPVDEIIKNPPPPVGAQQPVPVPARVAAPTNARTTHEDPLDLTTDEVRGYAPPKDFDHLIETNNREEVQQRQEEVSPITAELNGSLLVAPIQMDTGFDRHAKSRAVEMEIENIVEPVKTSSSFYRSNSLERNVHRPNTISLTPQHEDEFAPQTTQAPRRTELDFIATDGLESSKYFARAPARRVTLESPESPLNDFENVGTYVNLGSSSKKQHLLKSPGDDSVLSELGEFQSSQLLRRSFENEIDLTSDTAPSFARFPSNSGRRSFDSNSTPFQNNFNSIHQTQHNRSRPSSSRSRNQPTLFDSWSNTRPSTTSNRSTRTLATFRPKPLRNKITHHFGYQSVLDESRIGDDDDFMGL